MTHRQYLYDQVSVFTQLLTSYDHIIQWRIQDFLDGGANPKWEGGANLFFGQYFKKKMHEERNIGLGRRPNASWIRQCHYSLIV